MIYTDLTKKAMKLCFDAHKNQVDKSGMPYVFHPFHLAEQMTDERTTVAALLHDVMEDTEYTLNDLRHNSDLTRLDSVDEKALARIEKYRAAIRLLEE